MIPLQATALWLFVIAAAPADTPQLASGRASEPDVQPEAIRITRSEQRPARSGPAQNFTGSVRVEPLFAPTPSSPPTMPTLEDVRRVAPALARYTDVRLLGDLWKRPDLSPRDRSIITVTALIARHQTADSSGVRGSPSHR